MGSSSVFAKDDESFDEKPKDTETKGWSPPVEEIPPITGPFDEKRAASNYPLQSTEALVSDCPVCNGSGNEADGICGGFVRGPVNTNRACGRCRRTYRAHDTSTVTISDNVRICGVVKGVKCSMCLGSGRVRPA